MTRLYLLPRTDEAKAMLQSWIDHRCKVIKANCEALRARLGDVFDGAYHSSHWGGNGRPESVRCKTHPSPNWTTHGCPENCFRPKRSTQGGKELLTWLESLDAIIPEKEFLGLDIKDNPFNRVQIIGQHPKGLQCLVVPESSELRLPGFKLITAKHWEFLLSEAAAVAEERQAVDEATMKPYVNDLKGMTQKEFNEHYREARSHLDEWEPWFDALCAYARKHNLDAPV